MENNEKKKLKVIGRTCKHASTHTVNKRDFPRLSDDNNELMVIKEEVFLEDGTSRSNLKLVENAQRPYWIVKEAFRTFKDKREWLPKHKVDEHWSTDTMLDDNVNRVLGKRPAHRPNIRQTNRNPYVMGTDMTSAVWQRISYKQKWPEYHARPNKVAVYDIETDVIGKYALAKEEYGDAIIGATIAMHGKAVTVCLKDFVKAKSKDPEADFFRVLDRDMPDIKPRFDIQFIQVDSELDIITKIFDTLHEWQPDVVACWNLAFDVPRTASRIEAWQRNPKDYFCDPRIPEKYKSFYFKKDMGSKVSASGRKMNKSFYQCWHTVVAPASFTWLDGASSYWFIRSHKGNLPSGALDYILKKEIKRGKFDIDEAEGYRGLDKHIFMQENHPVEYMVYNLYDCVGILDLESKNNDMTMTIPSMLGVSEYRQFSSSPAKVMNNFTEFLLFKRGKVPGCTSDAMKDELDHYVVSEKNWIVALPTNNIANTGLQIVKEVPNDYSKVYIHCADLDVKSSYPTSTIIMNISRETTVLELSSIVGMEDSMRYRVGLNLMAGKTNAVSHCRYVHKLPGLFELRDIYRQSQSTLQ